MFLQTQDSSRRFLVHLPQQINKHLGVSHGFMSSRAKFPDTLAAASVGVNRTHDTASHIKTVKTYPTTVATIKGSEAKIVSVDSFATR